MTASTSLQGNDDARPVASLSFHDTVRARHSVRAFRPQPVDEDVIRLVLEDAQRAPSNCNTQPWQVHIVSGQKRDALSKVLLAKFNAGEIDPDFSFDSDAFNDTFAARYRVLGKNIYGSLGVARDDKEGRHWGAGLNFSFFNAPHVAFLFMPSLGDNVRIASDIGMYAQTFLLSLAAHGLGGIPQTTLGFFPGVVREMLGVPDDLKLMFGISFGVPDEGARANGFRMERADISESVTFHS